MSDATQPHETEYAALPSEIRNWGMLCHLSALAGLVVPGLAMFVGPLLIWLIKGKEHPFIEDQSREALNFQITMFLYFIVSALLVCVVVGFVLLPICLLANVVLVIVAALKASNGQAYRYPLTIRLVK